MDHPTPQDPKPAETKNHFKEYFKSRTFIILVSVLLELILLIGAFNLGLKVAFHKARYTYSWMRNYPANFGTLPVPGARIMDHEPGDHEFINSSGVLGQIVSNSNNTLTIKGVDNNEKTVSIQSDTAIRKGFTDIKGADLKAGDQVVVFGEADDQGKIEAKLIRVLNAQ